MKRRQTRRRPAIISTAVVAAMVALCCAAVVLVPPLIRQSQQPVSPGARVVDPRSAELTIAHSPEKAALFQDLVEGFNRQAMRTAPEAGRQAMKIVAVEMTPEEMVTQALAGQQQFQALTPDSSIWLHQLNRRWAQAQASEPGAIEPRLVGDPVRYAVTPVVIAAWEDTARALGWPRNPVRWQALQERAQSDPSFKWSHPSTAHASGLLATLAEFYAGAGVQRGLTPELALDPKTLEFVGAIEKTVRYYGESELPVIERAAREGPGYLDAFVISEQLVAALNSGRFPGPFGGGKERLIALYPAEGTLWADHPLALLETDDLTPNQRRTFQAFREYLGRPEVQASVLQAGYRPADLSIPLDSPGSPLIAANGVNPSEPQTTLQLPAPEVVAAVQNAWALTKRKTNVFLVADTSGSMEGEKLSSARAALRAFLAQVPSDQERVGLVEFNSDVVNIIELDTLARNRPELTAAVDALEAGGNTALLDAVRTAYTRLQNEADPERINAVVVMTDGRENASYIGLADLANEIRVGNQQVPVVIFAVAYGRDADYDVLEALANSSDGQVREGTPETIRELYKILSSYF